MNAESSNQSAELRNAKWLPPRLVMDAASGYKGRQQMDHAHPHAGIYIKYIYMIYTYIWYTWRIYGAYLARLHAALMALKRRTLQRIKMGLTNFKPATNCSGLKRSPPLHPFFPLTSCKTKALYNKYD